MHKDDWQISKAALTADVNLNHQAWIPIGGTTADSAFAGILDGAGYTVKNLYCKTNGEAGLFAWNKGTIKNLKVTGKVVSGDYAAAIASQNQGTIENCIADAAVTGGNYTAGITGENNGIITSCTNQGQSAVPSMWVESLERTQHRRTVQQRSLAASIQV